MTRLSPQPMSQDDSTAAIGYAHGKLILLGAGSRDLEEAPWISMGPILILFLTVLALNFAGDKLREYFDVREISL